MDQMEDNFKKVREQQLQPMEVSDSEDDLNFEENFVIEDNDVETDGEVEEKVAHESPTGISGPSKVDSLENEGVQRNDNSAAPVDMTDNETNMPTDNKQPNLRPLNDSRKNKPGTCFSSSDWSTLHLSKPLLKALAELGFERPTKIQKEAIPFALQGRDVLATAQTGSGKTAAFVLPILERLGQSPAVRQRRRRAVGEGYQGGAAATKALILLPTRELAAQCFDMLHALSKYTFITHALVTGGMSQKAQEMSLRQYPDIIIATPGRILDLLLNSPSVHVELLEIVVLDEADRLLELGFKDECLKVLQHCANARQTLLFSATLSEAIKDLAALSLRRPLKVDASTSHCLPSSLEQVLVPVRADESSETQMGKRESVLMHLCFETYKAKRTIVFFRTKKAAHRAALIFGFCGIRVAELHGNLPQSKRLEAVETFQNDHSIRFLLCSELAARGLDIPDVDLVINVAVPPESSRYIHQVGRTARIGKKGIAVTLYSPVEKLAIKRIVKAAAKESKSPVSKRVVAPAAWQKWEKRILELESQIKNRLKEEHVEREFRIAEMEVDKAVNMRRYEDDIMMRPKKRWLTSGDRGSQIDNKLKTDVAEDEAQLLKNVELATALSEEEDHDALWNQAGSDVDTCGSASAEETTSKKAPGIASKQDGKYQRCDAVRQKLAPRGSASDAVGNADAGLVYKAKGNGKEKSGRSDEKNRMVKAMSQKGKRPLTLKQKEILQEQRKTKMVGKKVKKQLFKKSQTDDYVHCGNSDGEGGGRKKKHNKGKRLRKKMS